MKTATKLGWLHACLTAFVTLGIPLVTYERHGVGKGLLFGAAAGLFLLLLGSLWGSVFKRIYEEGVEDGRRRK